MASKNGSEYPRNVSELQEKIIRRAIDFGEPKGVVFNGESAEKLRSLAKLGAEATLDIHETQSITRRASSEYVKHVGKAFSAIDHLVKLISNEVRRNRTVLTGDAFVSALNRFCPRFPFC